LAVTDWRLRRWRLWFLALSNAPRYELWRLRLFSFGGYGLALAALALVLLGAYDSYPNGVPFKNKRAIICLSSF